MLRVGLPIVGVFDAAGFFLDHVVEKINRVFILALIQGGGGFLVTPVGALALALLALALSFLALLLSLLTFPFTLCGFLLRVCPVIIVVAILSQGQDQRCALRALRVGGRRRER